MRRHHIRPLDAHDRSDFIITIMICAVTILVLEGDYQLGVHQERARLAARPSIASIWLKETGPITCYTGRP